MKKRIFIFGLLIFVVYMVRAVTLDDLINYAFENNTDIKNIELDLNLSAISSKTLDGIYLPSLNVTASASDILSENTLPGTVTSGISFNQSIPGGTSFGVGVSCSFYENPYSNVQDIVSNPSLNISLSQSLYPFWVQGKFCDPSSLSYKQKEKYFFLQLGQTKKTVVQNLIGFYFDYFVLCDEIKIRQNSISLLDSQVKTVKELQRMGSLSFTNVLEYENKKYSEEQELLSLCSQLTVCKKNLEDLCGHEIAFDILENVIDIDNLEFTEVKKDFIDEIYKLKFEMEENNLVLQKQGSAPVLNVSAKNSWILDVEDSSNLSLSVGINFSPLIQSLGSEEFEKQRLNHKNIIDSYNAYCLQKERVVRQYDCILMFYKNQLDLIEKSCLNMKSTFSNSALLYQKGTISEIEFKSAKINYDNEVLRKSVIERNYFKYKILKILSAAE